MCVCVRATVCGCIRLIEKVKNKIRCRSQRPALLLEAPSSSVCLTALLFLFSCFFFFCISTSFSTLPPASRLCQCSELDFPRFSALAVLWLCQQNCCRCKWQLIKKTWATQQSTKCFGGKQKCHRKASAKKASIFLQKQ